MTQPIFSVTDAVAALNQTLEAVYPTITVVGELSEMRVAREKWLYFDIKDEYAKLKCFGTVWQLKTPLEDGMQVAIVAAPRLHPLYGFSLNIQSVRPVGEGSLKKSADLLRAKLETEGLFAPERKRPLPYAPVRIGLITSDESAAFADFIKITDGRWRGVEIELYNVQVQGENAPDDIAAGIQYFNQLADMPEVLVIIRGGGSADDLAAFSTETVTRAVAGSRIPTLVAIGHEVDISLAELAADLAASTPSNAAELLFPDREALRKRLILQLKDLDSSVQARLAQEEQAVANYKSGLAAGLQDALHQRQVALQHYGSLLKSAHPQTTLKRGFALITKEGRLVTSSKSLHSGDGITAAFRDGDVKARVQ